MSDIVFYSSLLDMNGEIKLAKRVINVTYDPAPVRVDVVIHDKPVVQYDPSHSDPTLTIFYEPQELKKDDK